MPQTPRALSPSERVEWLRLIRSENVGPVTFYQLLARFGSAAAALEALPEIARRGGRQRPLAIGTKAAAERELQALAAAKAELLAWGEPGYPAALVALDDAPPLLSAKGRLSLLARPCIAIVGARNASANGRRFARDIAAQLGAENFVVVSGLSLGVLVVEAAARSGSLITARFALEQGREIFAVPGSPLDPRCRGANDLIRKGAKLVETAADVVEELAPLLAKPLAERRRQVFAVGGGAPPPDHEVEAARERVLPLLSPAPVPVDELVRQCQLSPALVVTVLLELELAGRIERQPGNRVALL